MTTAASAAFGPSAGSVQRRIRDLTGLVFPENRRETLSAGLARGMRHAGVRDLETYLSRVETEPAVLDDLVAAITVGETYFFRDPEQCRVIRDRILPEILQRRPGERLRLWSAGCATGEEAYTLAILHAEAGAPAPAWIVGSDLSRSALARAQRGRYARWSLRGVPPEGVARYFRRAGNEYLLVPDIRREVDFRYLNLVEDTYPSLASGISGMDLILCRNVLIYFDAEAAARVIRRLMDALSPGGWLLLGASDPLPADPGPCDVVLTGAGLAYRRVGHAPPPTPRPAAAATLATPTLPAGAAPVTPAPGDPASPPRFAPPPAPVRLLGRPPAAGPPTTEPALCESVAQVRSLANAGDLASAGRACAGAMDRHRTSPELAYLHGVLLAEAGRPDAAASALRASLYLDRNLAVAHLALAGALVRTGDEAGARRALRNAERLLASQPPDAEVPASDGERAGRLAAAARVQLALLAGEAP